MNILIIHNIYSARGGEETVVDFQKRLLEAKGHKVVLYQRDYKEINSWLFGKAQSMFTSIYNFSSIKELKNILATQKIDVAILHNLFPIISPCVIPFLHKRGIRVLQILHNYRLLCPIGLCFCNGEICERCLKGAREWNCFFKNCNGGELSSLSFAFKFWIIRHLHYYNSVDSFFALSEFQKNKLIENGFDKEKIKYLPNTYSPTKECERVDFAEKKYIGFVGRLTREKGFYDFVSIATQLPQYEFRVAGQRTEEIKDITIPKNLQFAGFLNPEQMADFYKQCKVILFLSRWYEGFPMVLIESFYYFTPLIVNNLSVMAEVVRDNKEGFVVSVGETQKIIEKIKYLFANDEEYEAMSLNCRTKFDSEYSVEKYYERLIKEIQSND